jgi:hypothetical protein
MYWFLHHCADCVAIDSASAPRVTVVVVAVSGVRGQSPRSQEPSERCERGHANGAELAGARAGGGELRERACEGSGDEVPRSISEGCVSG